MTRRWPVTSSPRPPATPGPPKTVTGPDGRPAAHGCGRPPPRRRGGRAPAPPVTTARDGPVYLPGGDHGPPGGYGMTRLDLAALTRRNGKDPGGEGDPGRRRELRFALEGLAGLSCGHRHQGCCRARSRREAPAPDRNPELHLHVPALPSAGIAAGLRAQPALRTRRPDLPVPGPGPSAAPTTGTLRLAPSNTLMPEGSAGPPRPAAATSADPPSTQTEPIRPARIRGFRRRAAGA